MAGEAVVTPLPASGEIVTPRPDRLGVADPDAEGGKLVISLLQAEGLVGILLTPLHELVAAEAVVIPVKDPVGLDKSDGFLRFHIWPPGTVLLPTRLASRDNLRGLIGQILDLWQLAKVKIRGITSRAAAAGVREPLITLH